ncbi:hypothetical protein CEXT_657321 [Caerostris extrusa]|uniref:Uncharacterized protein n=1 Tax=Caerostris extrusa TaxID=172846 RepID=A0AAV4PSW8_CAEEX|nr:hypothetical protein CEXT_657321 [Caerostris extrusa]
MISEGPWVKSNSSIAPCHGCSDAGNIGQRRGPHVTSTAKSSPFPGLKKNPKRGRFLGKAESTKLGALQIHDDDGGKKGLDDDDELCGIVHCVPTQNHECASLL